MGRSHCEGKTVLMQLLGFGEDPLTDICNHSWGKTLTIAIPRGEGENNSIQATTNDA
jgi:hypothetical protein